MSLKYFQQIVSEEFEVITALSAEEGLRNVERLGGSLGVVVSDQKLNGMQGTRFLTELRDKHPDIIRILATGFADVSTAVSAINDGAIFHFINKPWEPESLMTTVRRAMEHFELRAERDRLLREKAVMIREMIVSDRLAGYGVLAEGINHHLRNALVPVEVFLQLCGQAAENDGLRDNMDPEFLSQLRDGAMTQVRRITDILGRFAAVHQVGGTTDCESVSIRRVWEDVARQLESAMEERELTLGICADEVLPPVCTSRGRLQHALRLVIEDAIERLQPGSEINVSIEHRPAAADAGEHVLMEVWDSGPAVPDERLAMMFTPFAGRRENPQHLGVNLATCYVTLSNIGGHARAFNDPSRGTVLALSLPLEKSCDNLLRDCPWKRGIHCWTLPRWRTSNNCSALSSRNKKH